MLPPLDAPLFPTSPFKGNPPKFLSITIKSRRIVLCPCLPPVLSSQLARPAFPGFCQTLWHEFPSDAWCLLAKYHHHAFQSLFSDTFIVTFIQFLSVLNMNSYSTSSLFLQLGCNKFYQDSLKSFFLFLFSQPSPSLKSYYAKRSLLPSSSWSLYIQLFFSSISPAATVIL